MPNPGASITEQEIVDQMNKLLGRPLSAMELEVARISTVAQQAISIVMMEKQANAQILQNLKGGPLK